MKWGWEAIKEVDPIYVLTSWSHELLNQAKP